jgi:hypothetical protein
MTSDESYISTLPLVSLIEDVDDYGRSVFDLSAKTIHDLQKAAEVKRDRHEVVDLRKLNEREVLLAGFLSRIENVQAKLTDMRRADFAALSLVWNNNTGWFSPSCLHCHNADLFSRTRGPFFARVHLLACWH